MDWHPTAPADQHQYDPQDVFSAGLALHHIANTAYPIAHITTMAPYRVRRPIVKHLAPLAWEASNPISLYIHIPFCEHRCGFCEYTVLDPKENHANEDLYVDLLLQEIHLWRGVFGPATKTLVGLDIGGGTPSAISLRNLAQLLAAARQSFYVPGDLEISIETTPRIAALEPEKIRAYHQLGIQRISMGIQTINPQLLADVGRTATSLSYNRAARDHIRAAGFNKFNVDLMYGFANQPLKSLESTLLHAASLEPEYITLYRMRYKGTRLAHQAAQVSREQISTQADLIHAVLEDCGYLANPGKNTYSRVAGDPGTSQYLTQRVIHGTPYLGLGLGAQSLSQHTLAYNSGAADKRLRLYAEKITAGELPIQDLYHLSLETAVAKMVSVSFYFGEVDLASFKRKFGVALKELLPAEWEFVQRNNLMEIQADKLRLTRLGANNANGVIALFYAGAVKKHLIQLAAEGRTVPPGLPRPLQESI